VCKIVKEYKDNCISTKITNGIVERDDTDKQRLQRIGKKDTRAELESLTDKLIRDSVSQCFETMLNGVTF
jgi:hypothetical protein